MNDWTAASPSHRTSPAAAAALPPPHLHDLQQTAAAPTSCTTSADQSFRQLEKNVVAKYTEKHAGALATGKACAWFILDADWKRAWSSYVLGGAPAPPSLSNAALCDSRRTNRVRLGLVEDVDYVAVAPVVFYIFGLLYGLDDDDNDDGGSSAGEETPVIARFHTNVYGAECPPSVVKDVSRKAKQQAHVEVDRLMRRQHQFLLRSTCGSGMPGVPAGAAAAAATLTPSLVSSCCSSSASLCPAAAAGDGSGVEAAERNTPPLRFSLSMKQNNDKEAEEEEEKEGAGPRTPWCLRRVYGCCLLCIPSSFFDYLGEKRPGLAQQQPKAQEAEESGAGMDRDDDDIHSIISSSFSLRSLMEEDEEEGDDHELLLLWRNRQQQRQQQKSR